MPIIEYPFQYDQQNFEIFPEHIWNNPLIVFHGTSAHHSESIELNGFNVGVPPFSIVAARALLDLLIEPRVRTFDLPKGFTRMTTAQGLKHYLDYIEGGQARISLSNLSASCLTFSTGQLKGGQALHYITEAKTIIDSAIIQDENITELVTDQVNNLFEVCDAIRQAPGVVYAIRIPNNLENFVLENNIIYTSQPIHLDYIEGKVIVDNPPNINTAECNQKMHNKLFKSIAPVGLGILFGRQSNNDGDDIQINIIDPVV